MRRYRGIEAARHEISRGDQRSTRERRERPNVNPLPRWLDHHHDADEADGDRCPSAPAYRLAQNYSREDRENERRHLLNCRDVGERQMRQRDEEENGDDRLKRCAGKDARLHDHVPAGAVYGRDRDTTHQEHGHHAAYAHDLRRGHHCARELHDAVACHEQRHRDQHGNDAARVRGFFGLSGHERESNGRRTVVRLAPLV